MMEDKSSPRPKIVKVEIPCIKCRKPFLSRDKACNRICQKCTEVNYHIRNNYTIVVRQENDETENIQPSKEKKE